MPNQWVTRVHSSNVARRLLAAHSKPQVCGRFTPRNDGTMSALDFLNGTLPPFNKSAYVTGLMAGLNSRPFSTTNTTAKDASVQRKNPVANGKSVPS
jgi:hypothetical protein